MEATVKFNGTVTREVFMAMIEKIHAIRKSPKNLKQFGIESWLKWHKYDENCKVGCYDITCLAKILKISEQTIVIWNNRSECICQAFLPVNVQLRSHNAIFDFLRKDLVFDEVSANHDQFQIHLQKLQDDLKRYEEWATDKKNEIVTLINFKKEQELKNKEKELKKIKEQKEKERLEYNAIKEQEIQEVEAKLAELYETAN